jgi:hypothetical protein
MNCNYLSCLFSNSKLRFILPNVDNETGVNFTNTFKFKSHAIIFTVFTTRTSTHGSLVNTPTTLTNTGLVLVQIRAIHVFTLIPYCHKRSIEDVAMLLQQNGSKTIRKLVANHMLRCDYFAHSTFCVWSDVQ